MPNATTLDLVKRRLFDDATRTDQDELLGDLIEEADGEIETRIKRPIFATPADVVELYDGNGATLLELRRGPLVLPVTKVELLRYEGATVVEQEEIQNYLGEGVRDGLHLGRGALRWMFSTVTAGSVWPRGRHNVRVTYRGGWTDPPVNPEDGVPYRMRQAATIWVIQQFLRRDQHGIASKTIADVPNQLVSPRVLDDMMERALAPFHVKVLA